MNLNTLKKLVSVANSLDSKGFVKEADQLDGIIVKFATPSPRGESGTPKELLREALDEYSALAGNLLLDLYSEGDQKVADEVVLRLKSAYKYGHQEVGKPGRYTIGPGGEYHGYTFQAGRSSSQSDERRAMAFTPSELIQMATDIEQNYNQDNKPIFKIIMTGLGTTHMSGLNNMSAKSKWSAFVDEHHKFEEERSTWIQERQRAEPQAVRQRERRRAWLACDQQLEIMKLYKRYLDAQIGSDNMSDQARSDLESGLYAPPGKSIPFQAQPVGEARGLPNWSASDWPPASSDERRAAEEAYREAVEACIASKARAEEEQREWDERNPPIWKDME
mgnify:CR=1 FL=1|jgi:hypothetical protein